MRKPASTFLLALFVAHAACATPPPATPAPPPSGATLSGAEGIVALGLPAVIERPRSLLPDAEGGAACVDFILRAIGPAQPRVRVGSAGILAARFVALTSSPAACADSAGAGVPLLTLQNLADADRSIRLVLPHAAFPATAQGSKGRVLVFRDGQPTTEFNVALYREDYRPFEKGFLWFFGIALPAVLTALLALAAYRIQKWIDGRSVEREGMQRLLRERGPQLKSFFSGLYANIMELGDEELRKSMGHELAERQILSALPRRTLQPLLGALTRADRQRIAHLLAKAFPEYKEEILKPVEKSRSDS